MVAELLALVINWEQIVGVAGLAISAVGFGITIQQLRRTAKATEAVRSAVGQLKNRMAAFDYAAECVRASKSLQHASRLLKLKEWDDAATTLLDAQTTLHRLSISNEGRPAARISIAQLAEHLLEAISNLEEVEEKHLDYNYGQLLTTIRKHINILDTEVVGVNRDLYDDA